MTARADNAELEAAFNLLRKIYWREHGRGWREVITKIRNVAADPGSDEFVASGETGEKQ